MKGCLHHCLCSSFGQHIAVVGAVARLSMQQQQQDKYASRKGRRAFSTQLRRYTVGANPAAATRYPHRCSSRRTDRRENTQDRIAVITELQATQGCNSHRKHMHEHAIDPTAHSR